MKKHLLLLVVAIGVLMVFSGCTRILVASGAVPPPDEYENDDNRLAAKSIEIGVSQLRTISPLSDADWISFEATEGTSYTVETFARIVEPYGEADTVITLYDSSFSVIDTNDDIDGGDSTFSRIDFTADSSETHYIQVRGFGFISPGGYAVGVY